VEIDVNLIPCLRI